MKEGAYFYRSKNYTPLQQLVLFPGLAADERLFTTLDLAPHPQQIVLYPVPLKGENLRDYAYRMARNISVHPETVFIGVSFGGILAQEIARFIRVEKIILISSLSSNKQMPGIFHFFKWFPVYEWLPVSLIKQIAKKAGRTFTHKNERERKLFEAMIRDADGRIIRFGIREALCWTQQQTPAGAIHIHGTRDRLFPIRRIPADYVIDGGEHTMVLQNGAAISSIILTLTDN